MLIEAGRTRVICTASVEDRVPPFLRNSGKGWITAEYGMLPRSTHTRTEREAARGKQSGRTQEIQRLVGRSLRAAIDLVALGERQIRVEIADHGPGFEPPADTRDVERDSGWGLFFVSQLASRWGVEPGSPGHVWFEIDLRS